MTKLDPWALLSAALLAVILAHMIRQEGRPLRDWPSWADDLNPVHTHGVPSHE